MLFADTNRGRERYLTIIMNQMVKKLYDNNEYYVYDTMKERVEAGEPGNIDTLTSVIRAFRMECMDELLEALERQYEGFEEDFTNVYRDLAFNEIGIDYQRVVEFGPDIKTVYLMIANLLLEEKFCEGEELLDRPDFTKAFAYNMEIFAQLEAAAINTSRQLLEEDGLLTD